MGTICLCKLLLWACLRLIWGFCGEACFLRSASHSFWGFISQSHLSLLACVWSFCSAAALSFQALRSKALNSLLLRSKTYRLVFHAWPSFHLQALPLSELPCSYGDSWESCWPDCFHPSPSSSWFSSQWSVTAAPPSDSKVQVLLFCLPHPSLSYSSHSVFHLSLWAHQSCFIQGPCVSSRPWLLSSSPRYPWTSIPLALDHPTIWGLCWLSSVKRWPHHLVDYSDLFCCMVLTVAWYSLFST